MSVETPEAPPPPPAETPPFAAPAPYATASAYAEAPAYRPAAARRRRGVLWYAVALVAVVVVLGGFGMLYADDVNWQHQASDLRQQNSSLTDQLNTSKSDATSAHQQVKDLQGELQHPQLEIWNVPQQIKGPNDWLEGGIPDTFTYHLRATATGPMTVVILTYDQYATDFTCADSGQATYYQCVVGNPSVNRFVGVSSINYDFHLAEGCAGYLALWTASSTVTVNPDVGVTYNPAPTSTGACV